MELPTNDLLILRETERVLKCDVEDIKRHGQGREWKLGESGACMRAPENQRNKSCERASVSAFMYNSHYVFRSEDRCVHLLVHVSLRRLHCTAAGDTGRSEPRSVINTPHYPSFSAPPGWIEQERDDGEGWMEQKKVHTPLRASSSHSDKWPHCVERVTGF